MKAMFNGIEVAGIDMPKAVCAFSDDWKKCKPAKRSALMKTMQFEDGFALGLEGTRTYFQFFKDGTVKTVNLPRPSRQPLHLEIDEGRKAVGIRNGRVIYA